MVQGRNSVMMWSAGQRPRPSTGRAGPRAVRPRTGRREWYRRWSRGYGGRRPVGIGHSADIIRPGLQIHENFVMRVRMCVTLTYMMPVIVLGVHYRKPIRTGTVRST